MSRDAAFAVSSDMLRTDDAVAQLTAAVAPVTDSETVPLLDALGRILAEDVVAQRDNPPADNSAVDGYAVRFADLAADRAVTLPVTLRIAAGSPPGQTLAPGTAARIFTGAPLPAGTDTVLAQEVCRVDGESVELPPVKKAGGNVRHAGEDFRTGDAVLKAGIHLRPQELGLAAAIGRGALAVRRTVRVAVFSTGDEVCDPGRPAPPGGIYDSNRFTVMAMVRLLGGQAVDLGILPDRREALIDALGQAAEHYDLVLTSGGVSTGEEDHVKGAVEALGSLDFWRVAIRPGRPLAFGRIGRTPFLGLPGNPVASMVCFMIFARPLLMRLAGRNAWPLPLRRLPAGFDFKKRPGRREWLRGWIEAEGTPAAVLRRYPREGSGILSSMVAAQGLIDLAEDQEDIAPGDMVGYIPFAELWD
jgi:molybdopterin molybdotransferase